MKIKNLSEQFQREIEVVDTGQYDSQWFGNFFQLRRPILHILLLRFSKLSKVLFHLWKYPEHFISKNTYAQKSKYEFVCPLYVVIHTTHYQNHFKHIEPLEFFLMTPLQQNCVEMCFLDAYLVWSITIDRTAVIQLRVSPLRLPIFCRTYFICLV